MRCLLCNADKPELSPAYRPEGTLRDVTVWLCKRCGFLFSQGQPHGDSQPRPTPDASFGNLRQGKADRVEPHLEFLLDYHPAFTPANILDVGANRGHFVRAALDQWPGCTIVGIEPDDSLGRVVDDRVAWLTGRLEDFEGPKQAYDLIYLSHTLEHLANPRQALKRLADWTYPTLGLLLVEVPNMAFIQREDVLEEWFIDKHVSHFSDRTLKAILEFAGWRVMTLEKSDHYLTAVASRSIPLAIRTYNEPAIALGRLKWYQETRERNQMALVGYVEAWNKVAQNNRVAVWGEGRIFQAMRRTGLDMGRVVVVDRNGPSRPADLLPAYGPDYILVCSREYFEEIETEAEQLGLMADVRRWDRPPGRE